MPVRKPKPIRVKPEYGYVFVHDDRYFDWVSSIFGSHIRVLAETPRPKGGWPKNLKRVKVSVVLPKKKRKP